MLVIMARGGINSDSCFRVDNGGWTVPYPVPAETTSGMGVWPYPFVPFEGYNFVPLKA